jgi:trimeric autotransporter adhesin
MRNHGTKRRTRRKRFGFLGFALFVATLSAGALTVHVSPAEAATFTVNSTDDVNDNACTASHCSLREAINAANANADTDTITFNIPGPAPHRIQVTGGGLPAINFPAVVDATTEPDFSGTPIVELDGTLAAANGIGLALRGGASIVRGFVINRFPRTGIILLARGSYLIEDNYIGTDVTGTAARGNGEHGIVISREFFTNTNNAILRNVISGNVGWGIQIVGGDFEAGSNVIRGNRIGTDVSGTVALGNTIDGIRILAPNNTIGGTGAGDRNVISGNQRHGMIISGQGNGNGNLVHGNFIGTQADGTSALGNGSAGVRIEDSADNTIGGTAAGAGNVIAFNSGDGVLVGQSVNDSRWSRNGILSNSIFSNGELGIDLGSRLAGVTPNDPGDPDPGPNELQNFPVLTGISGDTIEGTLNSKPNTSYRLEFFANSECDPSMHGEGKLFLGATGVTTDGNGDAGFSFTSPTPVPSGQFVSATATDPVNSTSEFSHCLLRVTAVRISFVVAARTPNGVLVRWRTAAETQTLGFNLYRGRSGALERLNRALIPSAARGTTRGNTYSFLDRSAPRARASYRLQAVNLDGSKRWIASTAAGAR